MLTRRVRVVSLAALVVVILLGSAQVGIAKRSLAPIDSKPAPAEVQSFGLKQRGLSLANAEASRRVYQLIPELPLENQYVSSVTGDVAVNNTLISRLINYHTFIKGRTPIFRLDWKLTLADYLGVNERVNLETYPGTETLTVNPAETDIEIIRGLNRAQRDRLVDALVSVFAPAPSEQPSPQPTPAVESSPVPTPSGSRVGPPQPRPGDAQLLLP